MAQILEIPLNPEQGTNYLGNLPETGTSTLIIPDSVPAGAKQWHIYLFVTVEDEKKKCGRAYIL